MHSPTPEDFRPEVLTPPEEDSPDSLSGFRFVQLLLDPRGLHALMLAGGGLLAIGLVIWLAVIGLFDEPLHAAVGLGLANFSLLGLGVWLVAQTRYKLAGRATALLACLVMPLNLWFYDAQSLVTLEGEGSLWAAALVCCIVYAVVARLLKDSLFVYAFTAGAAMTGLLFLADGDVGHFWEVLAPSTMLVALGVACLHAERLFPATVSDEKNIAFTRDDFGRAFFRAGHVLLASGLGVLLAGRLAGRFYEAVFAGLDWFEQPHVATILQVKFAALGLALAGAYAYGYSRLVARDGRYSLFAVLSLAWSGVIGLDLLGIEFTEVLLVGLAGVLAIASRLLNGKLPAGLDDEAADGYQGWLSGAARALSLGGLSLLMIQFARGIWAPGVALVGFEFSWGYALAAAVIAASEALAAVAGGREQPSAIRWVGFVLAAVAAAGATVSLIPWSLFASTEAVLLTLTAIPAAAAAAGSLGRGRVASGPYSAAAEASAWCLVVLLAPYALFAASTTTLAATVVLAAVFAVTAATGRRAAGPIAAVLGLAAGAEAVFVFEIGIELALTLASGGCAAAIAAYAWGASSKVGAAGRIGLVLVATAGGLLASNRLLAGEAAWSLLGMLAGQAAFTGVAVRFTDREDGRSALVALAIAQIVAAGLVLNSLSVLTFVQRLEVFSTVVGAALVVAGLVGWSREAGEEDRPTDLLTDANLWIGALMATGPLTIGLVATRLFGGAPAWIALHELGVLAIGLALIGAGVLCRLRATTLAGGASLFVYLVSLAMLLQVPDQLQNVAVYLMVGGGAVFGGAVLMSVYRDRLLALPGRIRDGEGVFAVLKWR